MNYLIGAYCKVLALKVMHRRHKHSDCNAKMKGRGYKAIDTSERNNAGGGLAELVTCNDVPGRWVDVWRSGTFPDKQQVSECITDCKREPWND